VASAAQSANPSLQQSSSLYNIRPPQDKVNNGHNQIFDNLINNSAEKYNHSNNNKNGESDMDKGKAENCNNGSDDSGNINDDDTGDSDSSNSDGGNKARGYAGRQGLLKHRLQRSHYSFLILSLHTST